MLRLWIEAQSTPVGALVVFGLSYLVAATIFALVAIAAPQGWARDFNYIPPITLMLLVVLWLCSSASCSRHSCGKSLPIDAYGSQYEHIDGGTWQG